MVFGGCLWLGWWDWFCSIITYIGFSTTKGSSLLKWQTCWWFGTVGIFPYIYIYIHMYIYICIYIYISGIVTPTDFHIFQRGRYTTNQQSIGNIWEVWGGGPVLYGSTCMFTDVETCITSNVWGTSSGTVTKNTEGLMNANSRIGCQSEKMESWRTWNWELNHYEYLAAMKAVFCWRVTDRVLGLA